MEEVVEEEEEEEEEEEGLEREKSVHGGIVVLQDPGIKPCNLSIISPKYL